MFEPPPRSTTRILTALHMSPSHHYQLPLHTGTTLLPVLVPTAAVTKYHKFTALRENKFTVLQFWRSEVSFTGCQPGRIPPGGSRGKFIPCLF